MLICLTWEIRTHIFPKVLVWVNEFFTSSTKLMRTQSTFAMLFCAVQHKKRNRFSQIDFLPVNKRIYFHFRSKKETSTMQWLPSKPWFIYVTDDCCVFRVMENICLCIRMECTDIESHLDGLISYSIQFMSLSHTRQQTTFCWVFHLHLRTGTYGAKTKQQSCVNALSYEIFRRERGNNIVFLHFDFASN